MGGSYPGLQRSLLLILAITASISCNPPSGLPGAGRTLAPTRGYLVVSIDTLRADHLSTYGYERTTSPFLERLSARGVVFENTISPYPSTLTAHMSLFTGLYPQQHGVFPPDHSLSPELATLPEAFRRAGYTTAGFTEGGMMEGRYGFGRGFDTFSDDVERSPRDFERVLDGARSFLAGLSDEEPFFLFVHTYAVHAPYTPASPFDSAFWSGGPPDEVPPPTARTLRRMVRFDPLRARRSLPYYISQYDGSIAYVDAQLEEFFAELEAAGLLDQTTVITLSDHGEEFLEHGSLAHSQVYDETMRVPLIILHPEIDGPKRVEAPVELIDITATLVELAGLKLNHKVSGESLVPALAGAETPGQSWAFGHAGESQTLYLREGNRLLQLVVNQYPEGEWFRKRVSFDLRPGQASFSIRSYDEPRRIAVEIGEARPMRQWIGTDWEMLEIGSSERTETLTVHVSTPTCTPVRAVRLRCWSFQIRDPSPRRVELFDLSGGRASTKDIAAQEPELVDRLTRRLRRYRFKTLAPPIVEPPDEALLDRLRALGYLD